MQPFRAPSTSALRSRRDASGRGGAAVATAGLAEKRMPSGGGAVAPNMGRRIVSQGLARTQQRSGELGTSTVPAALQVDNTSFEEWMKMATDNKINATNTWSFALIDYFHDMSLLRSDSGDGSINFQKASCTLDGCVKVWTSRVDSVMAETGRLLSGLQDEDATAHGIGDSSAAEVGDRSYSGADDASSAVDRAGVDAEDQRRGKRRHRAQEATLAKSFAQLQVKRFDLEFSVDPLFKKTSADFDEDGAGGLLMNHLHVDDHMKVVFDASDVAATTEADDHDMDQNNSTDAVSANQQTLTPPSSDTPSMDMEKLRARIYAAAAQTNPSVPIQMEPLASLLDTRTICPSTANFTFAEGNEAAPPTMQLPELDGIDGASMDVEDMPEDLDGADGVDGLDFFDGQVGDDVAPTNEELAFDVAVAHNGRRDTDEHERLFDYFDQKMQKNWAGPEHWKMTRIHMKKPGLVAGATTTDEASSVVATDSGVKAKSRRSKEEQAIDFLSAEPPPPAKELFAPSATPSAIKLTKSAQSASDAHLLPEDHHFNSKRLLRLFLKPKATILLQRRTAASSPAGPLDPWNDEDGMWSENHVESMPAEDGGFDTGLFEDHDPYDDVLVPPAEPAPADAFDADSDIDEEAWANEAALRRVRPEFVDHAKRAKQVDVKRLKDNLWKSLDLDEHEPRTLDTALDELESMYTPAKYNEISTSFCFICLLHLANEEGLEIVAPSSAKTIPGTDGDTTVSSPGAVLAAAARAGRVVTDDDEDGDNMEEDSAHVCDLGSLQVRRDPHVEVA